MPLFSKLAFILIFLTLSIGGLTARGVQEEEQMDLRTMSWEEVTKMAEGQEVNFYMRGGLQRNKFLD